MSEKMPVLDKKSHAGLVFLTIELNTCKDFFSNTGIFSFFDILGGTFMKKIILMLFVLSLMLTSVAYAAEADAVATTSETTSSTTATADEEMVRVPLRVAQFPLIINSYMMPGADVQDKLNGQVDSALHVPLNDTLRAIDFISDDDMEAAYDEVGTGVNTKQLKNAVKPIAEKLNADLVVIPVLTSYEQWISYGWYWDADQILHSRASVTIIGYDAKKDEVFKKTASRFYDDRYSTAGVVSRLAWEAMDSALRDAQIHERIGAWKTNMVPKSSVK